MELEWRNRVTGLSTESPESLPFLGLWLSVKDGQPWPGTPDDLKQPRSHSEPTDTLRQSLRSLAAKIEPLWGKARLEWERLVPLDPTITSDLDLRDYERSLVEALPHLETLSHSPRGHLTVEEIREEIGRARRVSHRAVAALTAHSEDWQTRTFLGVRPRRILAESRKDQWDIYENRAVGTLRDRILAALHPRLQKLYQILHALDEASEHSSQIRGTRFRAVRLYRLWGEAFNSHPSRDRLARLISELECARTRLLSLADTFLFKQMLHFPSVESPLHSTNIFQSDAHYRQAFHLWHKWESVASIKPPSMRERAAFRRLACRDWDLFVLLLTIKACKQLALTPADHAGDLILPGQRISLTRNWTLTVQPDRSILLEQDAQPRLQIVGLYSCWRAQAEAQLREASKAFLNAQKSGHPVLIATVDDPDSPPADRSTEAIKSFDRLRCATLLSNKLGLVEVSPLKIDSTELIGRAIRWVVAENEWPRFPLELSNSGWSEAWPDLAHQPGIRAAGQNLLFSQEPATSLISEATERVAKAELRFDQTKAAREKLKQEERRARDDRRALAEVNIRKKDFAAQEVQEERLLQISTRNRECLLDARDRFQLLRLCPCCHSNSVEKQEDAAIMICFDCESEWGRRVCPNCRAEYAFIAPHDSSVAVSAESFDPVRIFGTDMCAVLLKSDLALSLTRLTECPWCNK